MSNKSKLHSTDEWVTRIDSKVVVGGFPFKVKPFFADRSILRYMQDGGIKTVVDLTVGYEQDDRIFPSADDRAAFGITHYLNIPIYDFIGLPTVDELHELVGFIAASPAGSVYVHCKAGTYRSPTIVAAYLINKDGLSVDAAIAQIEALRTSASFNDRQRDRLQEYFDSL